MSCFVRVQLGWFVCELVRPSIRLRHFNGYRHLRAIAYFQYYSERSRHECGLTSIATRLAHTLTPVSPGWGVPVPSGDMAKSPELGVGMTDPAQLSGQQLQGWVSGARGGHVSSWLRFVMVGVDYRSRQRHLGDSLDRGVTQKSHDVGS